MTLTSLLVKTLFTISLYCCLLHSSFAMVKYDEGRIEINGIQLLQDSENENLYYYIPPYPRVSTLPGGEFEFLCAKYVSTDGKKSSGGLFHALIQFSLTKEETLELEKSLREKFPKAVLMGPVPMLTEENGKGAASFRIVSSILKDSGKNNFTFDVVTSGSAPLLPGSKAAIAAHLSADGATLLWESFQGVTSDVSVVVDGYFRAKVRAYRATVKADLALVYDHFSTYRNLQSGFSKTQAQHVIDSLCQSGTIKIDIADLSSGLDAENPIYKNLLMIITEKVVDAMFDVNSGWAKVPPAESAVEPANPKERYQRGAFVRFFIGDGTQEYIPDDLLMLKKKTEIRSFNFFLDLNQSTVVDVPVHAAGNIRGFYNEFKDDKRYFRVIDMNDPDFQSRQVHFQIDGKYIGSFGDILDQVSILVQKDYADESSDSYSGSLLFNKQSIDSGNVIQSVSYRRLGDRTNEWLKYRYKVGWKFIGIDSVITLPADGWATTDLSAVSVAPPLERTEIEIGIDKAILKEKGIQSIRIRFASILFGKPHKGRMKVVRVSELTEPVKAVVYHDKDQPVVYQVNWYTNRKEVQDPLTVLKDEYLFLIPPDIK
jgi:hypothetical protein